MHYTDLLMTKDDLQNFNASYYARLRNINFSIKPSWSHKCWIQNIRSICGGNSNHVSSPFKSIQTNKKLKNITTLNINAQLETSLNERNTGSTKIIEVEFDQANLIKSSITFLSARSLDQTTLPANSIQLINEDNRWSLANQYDNFYVKICPPAKTSENLKKAAKLNEKWEK